MSAKLSSLAVALLVSACEGGPGAPAAAPPSPAPPAPRLSVTPIALPGATAPVAMDYIAYDRAHDRVWVPVGDTGSVDVLDVGTRVFTPVGGFKTEEREVRGRKRTMGPSAASAGDGVVYVGDRASSEVCAVDAASLEVGACAKLAAAIDGVAYVASAKEVWVTTPRDHAIVALDAATLKPKATVKVDGEPEGYAVDDAHGVFFTNLEDKDKTLAIDIATHAVRSTWTPSCGADGPRGLAVDGARAHVFVACTDHLQVLDAAHDGAPLGKLDTGAGVDNIDYAPSTRLLYVAAGKSAKFTLARADDTGALTVVATVTTAPGARNAVADAAGNAYLPDPEGAHLLVISSSPR